MTIELFRGEHPARPLDGCWTPDPIGAATFAVAPGLDGQGVLITALLSTEEVTVEDCAGMVRPAKGGADAVFAADDPSLRAQCACGARRGLAHVHRLPGAGDLVGFQPAGCVRVHGGFRNRPVAPGRVHHVALHLRPRAPGAAGSTFTCVGHRLPDRTGRSLFPDARTLTTTIVSLLVCRAATTRGRPFSCSVAPFGQPLVDFGAITALQQTGQSSPRTPRVTVVRVATSGIRVPVGSSRARKRSLTSSPKTSPPPVVNSGMVAARCSWIHSVRPATTAVHGARRSRRLPGPRSADREGRRVPIHPRGVTLQW